MRAAAGLLVIVTMLLVPAGASAQTPDSRIIPVPASFQVDLSASGPQVLTAMFPADATGTVQFRIDDNPIGGPVPVVAGTARSEPVTLPQGKSITLRMDYSGDERYQPVAAITHADYRPEETPAVAGQPEPAASASPAAGAPPKRLRTLPRTGAEIVWTASAGVVFLLAGLAAGRRRRLGAVFRGR